MYTGKKNPMSFFSSISQIIIHRDSILKSFIDYSNAGYGILIVISVIFPLKW
jgi:hypothetical protein